jgi:hypothetical protein
MNAITVNKNQLIEKLNDNRANHREIFLEAQEGYRKAVIAELDSMLADARAGKNIRTVVSLRAPVDQTKDYDCALAMLAMHVEETISLTQQEFQCYVLDQWGWKNAFNVSNAAYSPKLSAMLAMHPEDE